MSELKKEELLKKLRNWWMSLDKAWPSFQLNWTKKDQQAYGQIVQIIKFHFSDDWQQVKKELGKFMQKQKLEVTEEWIEEKARYLHDKVSGMPNSTCNYGCGAMERFQDFIHSLVEEIKK